MKAQEAAILLSVTTTQVNKLARLGMLKGTKRKVAGSIKPVWVLTRESVQFYKNHRRHVGRPRKQSGGGVPIY